MALFVIELLKRNERNTEKENENLKLNLLTVKV